MLALLSDSTNAEVEGYTMSEQEVCANLETLITSAEGRVIVALFASNVNRIQQIMDIAVHNNRRVIFTGRSMDQITSIAMQLGHIKCPPSTLVDIKQIGKLKDDELVIITTGSQGEPMSALARMATGVHKHVSIRKGDCVILSSKYIPGNERAIAQIINRLYRRGADVVYSKIAKIHTSGHAPPGRAQTDAQPDQTKVFLYPSTGNTAILWCMQGSQKSLVWFGNMSLWLKTAR